jgi:hypothetical protein
VTQGSGKGLATIGLFSFPRSITREENYPVNADGSINGGYNPDKAEEIITAKWDTRMGVTITSTSYAWSWPGYDDFIIYEYELENTGNRGPGVPVYADTLREMALGFVYGLAPSMFAMQQKFNEWAEGDARANVNYRVFARLDLKRYLSFNHTIDGFPESNINQNYFDAWSSNRSSDQGGWKTINGGGLAAPAAVGYMPLYYDYDHLETQNQTHFLSTTGTASSNMWDVNNKMKQPYCIAYQNGNLDFALTSQQAGNNFLYLNGEANRQANPFAGSSDSSYLGPTYYWIGRGKTTNGFFKQPVSHVYVLGPYIMLPGEKMHFAIAEVAGYGAGVRSDKIYSDFGGGGGSAISPVEPTGAPGTDYFHPVTSWYDTLMDANVTGAPRAPVGSNYLQSHPLPWYVDTPVVSIRDVADRAIQMYTGRSLIKYDTSQYEPAPVNLYGYPGAPYPGVYTTVPIPCPAPAIVVANFNPFNIAVATMQITWGTQVESLTRSTANWSRLHAPLKFYVLMRTLGPNILGPWQVLDTVVRQDPRYVSDNVFPREFKNGNYIYYDQKAQIGASYYYAVVSVDSLGGKSGLTNLTYHNAQLPAVAKMSKVYAAPNPFIVTSHSDNTNKIYFMGLPKHATIRVFSFNGQLVQTIEHNIDAYTSDFFQISQNGQWIASGVYYFTVDDHDTGDRAWNKFVIIH